MVPHAEVQQTYLFVLSKMKECVDLMERHRIKRVPWEKFQKDDPQKYEELLKDWKKNMAEVEKAVEGLRYALREWK